MLLANPAILDGLGYGLVAVGSTGLIALIISDVDRQIPKSGLCAALTVIVIAGGGLIWRAETLRHADRDLSPHSRPT